MKCPRCGSENLSFYAFSISPDCGVNCNDCDFSLISEVSWEGCTHEKEHDQKCYDHLVNLINKEHEARIY